MRRVLALLFSFVERISYRSEPGLWETELHLCWHLEHNKPARCVECLKGCVAANAPLKAVIARIEAMLML